LQCRSTHRTCPLTFSASHSVVVGWSTRPTSAAFRRGPRGPIHRVMDSPCLSAGGLRFLGHPVPAAGLSRPSEDRRAYWPAGQTASGFPRSAPVETRRGWVPPILRGLGAPACRGEAARLDQTEGAVWFLAGSSSRQPSVATTFRNAASTEIHSRSPIPSFPRPVRLDGSGSPWASPACFRTPRYRGACAGREPTWALVGAVVTRHLPLI
jgi:hypothetical protein